MSARARWKDRECDWVDGWLWRECGVLCISDQTRREDKIWWSGHDDLTTS